MKLVLCQLYPEHLSIYADRGNVQVIRRRLEWRGIELEERPLRVGEALDPEAADLYLIGGGQDRDQLLVAEDLQRHREALHAAVAGGAAVLAVCGGYQLAGHATSAQDGGEMPGIGLLDLETRAGDDADDRRHRVRVRPRRRRGRAHARRIREPRGPDGARPGLRAAGAGRQRPRQRRRVGLRGRRAGSVLGTYVHGPLLPKNPWLADWLIARALERRHGGVELAPLDDRLELAAADAAAAAGR